MWWVGGPSRKVERRMKNDQRITDNHTRERLEGRGDEPRHAENLVDAEVRTRKQEQQVARRTRFSTSTIYFSFKLYDCVGMNAGSAAEAVTQGTALVSIKMFKMRSCRPAAPMIPDRAMAFGASQTARLFFVARLEFENALDCLTLPLVSILDFALNTPWHHSCPRSGSLIVLLVRFSVRKSTCPESRCQPG